MQTSNVHHAGQDSRKQQGQGRPGRRQGGGTRQEFAGRYPHWASLVAMIELSQKVGGLWGSTVGATVVETPVPPAEAPIVKPTALRSTATNVMIGFYNASAPAVATGAKGRPHPLDVLGSRRF